MINYGKQYGSVSPQPVEITATSVFVASNIQKITREVNDREIEEYEYDLVRYDIEEFLLYQATHMTSLEEELAATKILLGVD